MKRSLLGAVITPEACVKARGLMGSSTYQLAGWALCSALTVRSFEKRQHRTSVATKTEIRRALDEAGGVFDPLAEGGYEVRICAVAVRMARWGVGPMMGFREKRFREADLIAAFPSSSETTQPD